MKIDALHRGRRNGGDPVGSSPTVWLIRLTLVVDDGEYDHLRGTLSADEQDRAAHGHPDVRRRFVACRNPRRHRTGCLAGVAAERTNRRVFRAWVAKEAMLTSLGYGIGAGMDHFALPMPWDAEPALTMGAT